MSRVVQDTKGRGSLRWIQLAVNSNPELLQAQIAEETGLAGSLTWVSPVAHDEMAEYRDAEFLARLDLQRLSAPLSQF